MRKKPRMGVRSGMTREFTFTSKKRKQDHLIYKDKNGLIVSKNIERWINEDPIQLLNALDGRVCEIVRPEFEKLRQRLKDIAPWIYYPKLYKTVRAKIKIAVKAKERREKECAVKKRR